MRSCWSRMASRSLRASASGSELAPCARPGPRRRARAARSGSRRGRVRIGLCSRRSPMGRPQASNRRPIGIRHHTATGPRWVTRLRSLRRREGSSGPAATHGAVPDPGHPRIRTFHARHGRVTEAMRSALADIGPRHDLARRDPTRPLVLEVGCGARRGRARLRRRPPRRRRAGRRRPHARHRPPAAGPRRRARGRTSTSPAADALDLLDHVLGPGSLAGVHVFFPDPWPKARHHKRRFIRPDVVDLLADRLVSGGQCWSPPTSRTTPATRGTCSTGTRLRRRRRRTPGVATERGLRGQGGRRGADRSPSWPTDGAERGMAYDEDGASRPGAGGYRPVHGAARSVQEGAGSGCDDVGGRRPAAGRGGRGRCRGRSTPTPSRSPGSTTPTLDPVAGGGPRGAGRRRTASTGSRSWTP